VKADKAAVSGRDWIGSLMGIEEKYKRTSKLFRINNFLHESGIEARHRCGKNEGEKRRKCS
jgi:hypothetical protein